MKERTKSVGWWLVVEGRRNGRRQDCLIPTNCSPIILICLLQAGRPNDRTGQKEAYHASHVLPRRYWKACLYAQGKFFWRIVVTFVLTGRGAASTKNQRQPCAASSHLVAFSLPVLPIHPPTTEGYTRGKDYRKCPSCSIFTRR